MGRILVMIVAILLAFAAAASPAVLPPVPPTPPSGWPAAEVAEPFARNLMASTPAAELASSLTLDSAPPLLRNLGSALMTSDRDLQSDLETYLNALSIAAARRPGTDLRVLLALQVIDPPRYRSDPAFRQRINHRLPHALDATVSREVREACYGALTGAGIDYETAEAVAFSWKLAARRSGERRVPFAGDLRMPDDVAGPIAASIFSMNSRFFTSEEAKLFLTAVRAASPKRRIVVLADAAIQGGMGEGVDVHFVDSAGRPFTPWPRDPFLAARAGDGAVVFVNRPNAQPKREEDANFVQAIVSAIPDSLDREWKKARWTVAPVPFHNGHVLLMPDAAWISIHTVEIRALEILGLDRVPVETFHDAAGIKRYVEAVNTAARELDTLYRRAVRFVHPLPDGEPLADQIALMQILGGGAGFDLDSLLTLLPRSDGSLAALVGDLRLGSRLARGAAAEEWQQVHRAYGFAGDAATLGARIAEAQDTPRTAGLQLFLDLVAAHLDADRLPLLNVPLSLLEDRSALGGTEFLLTWNNVVLEQRRAEGFASLFAPGDAFARRAFADAGYRLELFPPLIRSIVLNGGYRCASNHLR